MMSRTVNRTSWRQLVAALSWVALLALPLVACGGGEAGVAGARAGFIAEMQAFKVLGQEGAGEAAEADAAASEESAADGDASAEGAMTPEPQLVDVLLDILIHNEGNGALDGITLDLTIADPDGAEKERRLLYVETLGLTKGSQSQITYELTDVAYVEGDGFHVEVRRPIPLEEQGDYREFAAETE